MKFFFSSFILGVVVNLFIFSSNDGFAFYPEFTSHINEIQTTAISPFIQENEKASFILKTSNNLYHIKNNGRLDSAFTVPELVGISGNGEYYILYDKVGTEIELWSGRQRFWRQKSMEYPYLSYSGNLIFLLNGDQSSARVIDHNGNSIGVKNISGRICTVIAFAGRGNFGAAGFLDGTFQVVNGEGAPLLSGSAYAGGMVKSLALSDNGKFAVIHGGDVERDHVELYNIEEGRNYIYQLPSVHKTKTAISVSNDGSFAALDRKSVLFFDRKARLLFEIAIDEKRDGQASIKENESAYFVGYTTRKGLSKFMVVTKRGLIIYAGDFPGESFLDLTVSENLIFLRGSDNLFCYSLHRTAE